MSFVDTHTLALLATGRNSGLVVDVGYWETCVMPVYAGRPMHSCLASTPRAGRRLHTAVEALVGAYGAAQGAPLDEQLGEVVHRVTTEALVVGARPPASCDCSLPLDVEAMKEAYGASHAEDAAVRTTKGQVRVPGWIRTAACEALWENGDEDELGIVACVRQCITRLPLDVRREILDAVVLAGGTAQLPHFAHRLEDELNTPLPSAGQVGQGALPPLRVRVLNAGPPDAPRMLPIPPNLLAWTGGSLAASLGTSGVQHVSRAQWRTDVH